jgi:hypothetical protein
LVIIDSHAHLFAPAVLRNVIGKPELAAELHLETAKAGERMGPAALCREAAAAGVEACLLLPTAKPDAVARANRDFHEIVGRHEGLLTLGTLHPHRAGARSELAWLRGVGIRGIKLCSFSQGFGLEEPRTRSLFRIIEKVNGEEEAGLFVVLDTFCKADRYFGASPRHLTTPERLGRLVQGHPGIDFVGAHMGGLAAPFDEIVRHLPPARNLYLDTSNAAHTLREDEFVHLLRLHGPERILFGTDWPWFGQREEMGLIDRLMDIAGFDPGGKAAVFGGNAERLLGIGFS